MEKPEHHALGDVALVPGLVVEAMLGRARSLLLYRTTFRDQPALAMEYAPIGLVERGEDGALVPVASLGASVAGELFEAASRWHRVAIETRFFLDALESETAGMGEVVPAGSGFGWFVLPVQSAEITSLAARIGSGPSASPLTAGKAASFTRAIARDLALKRERGLVDLNISPETVLQLNSSQKWSPTQALAPLPDERGLFDPVLYNKGIPRHYAPPEMRDAAGRLQVGPASDIYSASAVIAYAISGEAPPDFTAGADVAQWLAGHPIASQHSERFRAAIAAGLAVDPQARPQSVVEWLEGFGIGPEPMRGGMIVHGWHWTAPRDPVWTSDPVTDTRPVTNNRSVTRGFYEYEPAGSVSNFGGFIAGLIIAAALAGAAFGFTWALANVGIFDETSAFTFFGLVVAAIAAASALVLRSPRPSGRFVGVGGLVLTIPLILFCAAMAWEARPAPEPPEGPFSERTPEAEPTEAPVDVSGLTSDDVYRLKDGRWVDLSVFGGVYGRSRDDCTTSPAPGLLVINVQSTHVPLLGPEPKQVGVARILTPGGIIYGVTITGGATPGAQAVQQTATEAERKAWLASKNEWWAEQEKRLTFDIVGVARSDGGDVNRFQPKQIVLTYEGGDAPALEMIRRHAEEDGVDDEPEKYFECSTPAAE